MGEKGNVEVVEQLKEMARQQEPGLRDRVMQLLDDYETITGLAPGAATEESAAEDPGTPPTPPPPTA